MVSHQSVFTFLPTAAIMDGGIVAPQKEEGWRETRGDESLGPPQEPVVMIQPVRLTFLLEASIVVGRHVVAR